MTGGIENRASQAARDALAAHDARTPHAAQAARSAEVAAARTSRATAPSAVHASEFTSDEAPHGTGVINRALLRSRRGARLQFSAGNTLRLFQSGTDYFAALVERIRAARKSIVLEVYIFCVDDAGAMVSAALVEAAQRGLSVRVITDGIGTPQTLPYYDDWRAHGVRFRIFNPHLFGRFGFSRTHRKIVSIDGEVAFVGGINIVDDLENDGVKLDEPRWDFAVEMAGPVAVEVDAAFEQQWRRLERNPVTSTLRRTLTFVRGGLRASAEPTPRTPQIAFVARDNLNRRRTIEKAYLHAIGRAWT